MSDRTFVIDGAPVPRFLYGTAWKEDDTRRLTELALQQGFRGIDTANQRKHYHEAAVGEAVRAVLARGLVSRDDLFLQTKFTFRDGQDHRLPYDAKAPIALQVAQSFASSLEHLGVERIDSYVLHGPSQHNGLGAPDWEAWRAMEAIHADGRVRWLGISNTSLEQLQLLCQEARVQPRFVQNRCYAVTGWDRRVREFCAERGIIYQGFSLLTANRDVIEGARTRRLTPLGSPKSILGAPIAEIARCHGRSPAQIVFRFALAVGMMPLTGTTNAEHMRADLEVFDFHLQPDEVKRIEAIALNEPA